jgi:mono/diheme cytochrome c family protein
MVKAIVSHNKGWKRNIVPSKRRVTSKNLAGSAAAGTAVLLAGWLCSAAPQTAASPAANAAAQTALVNKYCIGCHNDKLKTANLSLQGLDLTKPGDDAAWEKVLRKVSANQMPPMNLPHPDEAARKAFTSYLETELDRAAAAHPNPGHPTIHRLNRAEYSNAIRDLFALDIQPGASLPPDDSGYGFDNIGDVLSLSPVLIERYMSVGRTVARLAVGDTDVKPQIDVFAPVKEVRAASKGGPKIPRNERISDELPFDSAGGLSFQYTFPVDAEYVFKVKLPGGDGADPAKNLELRVPVKAGVRHVGLTFMRSSAVPEILPTLGAARGGGGAGAGRGGAGAPQMAHLDLRLDGERLKLYDIPEGPNGGAFNELSIGGPYNVFGGGDTPSREKIFVCKPASPKDEDACAHKIMAGLARRAFRRPVTETDLKPLLAFYASGRKEKDFDNGIEMALRAMLVSPDFLFRIERDPANAAPGSVHRVNDYELASRLSFFLWSSIPDDELLGLADKGQLRDPKVVEKQVARMLDDPKAKAFSSNFAGQYLYLRNLAAQKPDPDEFPEFDNNLRHAFEQETQLFFNAIVRENRPVTDLLNANFTYLNQRLAEFYGIPGVYGPQFRRVTITDPNRAGILGQGSLLTVTSYPNRTSVVQRGKWVLENLLGTPPPPPPPNVPALDPHGKDGKMSMRQAMEMHRANPVCASCHSRMDPIGFALENFNAIGEWRDKDNGTPIDASGKLPDGATFTGAAGLKALMLSQHKDEFISTFTEKLMIYALGRGLESYDQPAVRSIMREASKENYEIQALIRAIIDSPQFQMRRTKES